MPVSAESLRERGVILALQQVKGLHGAPFGVGDAQLPRAPSSPHGLSQHLHQAQRSL
jgi:hypothetical protein